MKKIVTNNKSELNSNSLIIDSAKWSQEEISEFIRIDHHISNEWVNLDSVYSFFNSEKNYNERHKFKKFNITTSYLDPDAIISAAIIDLVINDQMNIDELKNSQIGKILYSASFFCDYNTTCMFLDKKVNKLGHKLETYLRHRMETELGETRGQKETELIKLKFNSFFTKYTSTIKKLALKERLSSEIMEFDDVGYILNQSKYFKKYIYKLSNQTGLIRVVNESKRIIPRSYYKIFDQQSIVIRIIDNDVPSGNAQIFIGVNPYIPDWEKINLITLSKKLRKFKGGFNFSGRRMIIGNENPVFNIEKLIKTIDNLDIILLKDNYEMQSIYNS